MRTTLRSFKNLLGLGYASPRRYWERRYRRLGTSVTAPGCIDLDAAENERDYAEKWRRILCAVRDANLPAVPGVLDAGCGNGVLTERMVRQGWAVTAVDFSQSALKAARERIPAGVTWHCSNIESFDPGRQFDLVINVDVLHHVVDEKPFRSTLSRLCALARPSGLVLVNTHLADDPDAEGERSSHVRWRTLDEFSAALPPAWKVDSHERYFLAGEEVTKDLLIISHAQ